MKLKYNIMIEDFSNFKITNLFQGQNLKFIFKITSYNGLREENL